MILKSITVGSWRCYLDPVTVGPLSEGLNVIHAPNATGKSTLFEALRRALMDSHRVTGRDVESIRPWGRALAPTVTVEFTHESIDYRITKRFLDGPAAKLERKETGRFVPLAEGSDADEKVRRILSRNAPGRGLSRTENWGMAQILWAPQGDLVLTRVSGDLLEDIRASLGTQISGAGSGPVEKRIEELYLQVFTAGGKLKAGKDAATLVRLRERLDEVTDKLSADREHLQRFDEASRRVEDLRARRAQAKRDAETINDALKDARSQADVYKSLLSEQAQWEGRVNAAEARYRQLKSRIDQIKEGRDERAEARARLSQLSEAIPLHEREVESRQKAAATAKAAMENARKGRRAVEEARQLAEQAHAFVENGKKLSTLKDRIGKIETAQQTLDRLKKQCTTLVAPDAKTLKAIRNALKARDEAQFLINSALITLEIVPSDDGSLEVLEGEQPGTLMLRSGSPTQIKGSPEVVAELPGVARLRAWGPPGSINEHRKARASAERTLRKLTEPFGTDDMEELEQRGDRASEIEREVSAVEAQIETLFGDQSLDDIVRERSRLEGLQRAIVPSYPEWETMPPDDDALKRAAQEIQSVFIERVEAAEIEHDTAQSALTAATTQRTRTTTQMEEATTLVSKAESKLAKLTTDGKRDDERESDLHTIALEWDAARAGLKKTEERLSAFTQNPITVAGKFERQLEALSEVASKALENEKIEEGRLQTLAAEGPYSTVARLEEELAELNRQNGKEGLRVDAIRLIRNTVDECRSEALSAVTGPVEAAATRTLRRIAGDRLGTLKLGEGFEPFSVMPGVSGSSVGLENVSGGEWEQIHLATRLALAEVLARGERQMVVLDDVLAATDAGRLARVMTILEETAQRLQIVVLTCHPERYRGLEGANFVDLEAIARGG